MGNNILYITLFAIPALGSVAAFLFKNKKTNFPILMGFVGAFLLAIVLAEILPHLYVEHNHSIALFILLGFFLESILETLFGVEIHECDHHDHQENHKSLPVGLFFALAIHSFTEGIPLASNFINGFTSSNGFIFGICLHEFIACFSIVLLLIAAGVKRKNALFIGLGYALILPLGAIVGHAFDLPEHSETMQILVAISVGTILHVSMDVLGQPLHSKSKKFIKLFAIVLGVLAGYFLSH